jgi:hypothetical protein
MSKHDNIYNILGKLASLEPKPPKQENILKQLNEGATFNPLSLKDRLAKKLAETKEVDEDMLAKKDFDGDGRRESSKKEYMGSRDKAIKQAMGKTDKDEVVDEGKHGYSTYEPKNAFYKPGTTDSEKAADREKQEKSMIDTFKKSGEKVNPGSQIHALMKKHGEKVDEGANDVVPDKSWVKDPSDPASKVPAFQRKANEPGRQAAQGRADSMNASSGAKVWSSGRPAPMEEEQYDENNAHSSLPGVRKVSDEEHSEYDAAAHTVRKWMRKRGWDPKSEFKPAMKYILDNLDSEHDDTLTDDVKMAACTCHKHHSSIEKPVEEGFPTVDDARKRAEQEKGTGKFDKQQTSTGTRYTRKSDTFSDDDSEDTGTSDAPKKRGRPAKNKGPERTTSKAWKHKGARVSESINLETYVEDTMAELDSLFVFEKAKSKAQQKFFGMVHAAQKGEKPASKEVAKVAKDMGKKDAKDFASTKHKGLPDKVKKKKVDESVLTESSLQAIVRKFGKEVREFAEGHSMDEDLFEALYDYYFDDMPYGVKKARDGDPYQWVAERFEHALDAGDVEVTQSKVHKDLDELAALAGIHSGHQVADEGNEFSGARAAAIRAGKDTFMVGGKTFHVTDAEDEMHESSCNMTAEGQMCPVHGLAECGGGMMYESEDKPDFTDVDNDGDEKESWKKAEDDKEEEGDDKEKVDECGVPVMVGAGGGQESGMSVNTSMDTKTGRKTLTVTADGDAAEELAQMLKIAGLGGGHAEPEEKHVDVIVDRGEEVDEDFANKPEERIAPMKAATPSGDDMHKSKTQYKHSYKQSDNPMAMRENSTHLEARLARLLDKIKD